MVGQCQRMSPRKGKKYESSLYICYIPNHNKKTIFDTVYLEASKTFCGDATLDDLQRRFLAQHSVATLLRHRFEWLQHCSSVATLCCAKIRTRRFEWSRVTSPLGCFET